MKAYYETYYHVEHDSRPDVDPKLPYLHGGQWVHIKFDIARDTNFTIVDTQTVFPKIEFAICAFSKMNCPQMTADMPMFWGDVFFKHIKHKNEFLVNGLFISQMNCSDVIELLKEARYQAFGETFWVREPWKHG